MEPERAFGLCMRRHPWGSRGCANRQDNDAGCAPLATPTENLLTDRYSGKIKTYKNRVDEIKARGMFAMLSLNTMNSTLRGLTKSTPVRQGLRLWSLCVVGETMSAAHYANPAGDFIALPKASDQAGSA